MTLLTTCSNLLSRSIAATTVVLLLAGNSVAVEGGAKTADTPAVGTGASQPNRINVEYVKGYLSDAGKIVLSPASWDKSDWLKAGLVVGTTAGLFLVDREARNLTQRNQGSLGDAGATIGNAFGNPLYTLPPLGLLYLYGHVYEDGKARRASLLAVESLALSGAFTWTVKLAAHRHRPYSGESASTWDGPGFKTGDTSFPSGHTTAAFSVAAVLAEEYGDNSYVAPIAYGLATLTGLARVYDNQHWASDAFLGGAIGYFVGKAVVRYHAAAGSSALKVLPTVSQQGFGMLAEYRF